jgi:hypothetical protein
MLLIRRSNEEEGVAKLFAIDNDGERHPLGTTVARGSCWICAP